MKKLRIALLSKWHVHAQQYANEFRSYPDCEVAAVWDTDAARGAAWAEELGCGFEPELKRLLARGDIDAVCVATETAMHGEVLTAAADAGKHIFTEKVLAATMADAEKIKAAVQRAGVKFCISFPHRCMREHLYVKKLVESGALGDVTLLRIRNAHDGAVSGWLPGSFYVEEDCGGGAMMDLGAHPMYLAAWYMGEPRRVTSMFTHVTGKAVEDNAVSLIEFGNGSIAVSETGFVSKNSPMSLEIAGTKGSVFAFGPDRNVKVNAEGMDGWRVVPTDEMPPALPAPTLMFARGVINDEPIPFGLDDAVMLSRLMQGAYESHKTGRTTELGAFKK